LRISIDPNICSGHGRCYNIAPTLFVDDDRCFGVVIGGGEIDSQSEQAAHAAVLGCPEHAITIDEA
jgi:ferredoxin